MMVRKELHLSFTSVNKALLKGMSTGSIEVCIYGPSYRGRYRAV